MTYNLEPEIHFILLFYMLIFTQPHIIWTEVTDFPVMSLYSQRFSIGLDVHFYYIYHV